MSSSGSFESFTKNLGGVVKIRTGPRVQSYGASQQQGQNHWDTLYSEIAIVHRKYAYKISCTLLKLAFIHFAKQILVVIATEVE